MTVSILSHHIIEGDVGGKGDRKYACGGLEEDINGTTKYAL